MPCSLSSDALTPASASTIIRTRASVLCTNRLLCFNFTLCFYQEDNFGRGKPFSCFKDSEWGSWFAVFILRVFFPLRASTHSRVVDQLPKSLEANYKCLLY